MGEPAMADHKGQAARPAALTVFGVPTDDSAARDLRQRAGRLFNPAAPLPDDVPWTGDHIMNPEWGDWPATPRPAAVLVLMAADQTGLPALLFIVRAAHLKAHAGQIALPGGKTEHGETPATAALREAREEVGLPAEVVEPLGLADPYMTRTGFLITPLIGILREPVPLDLDPGEVADAFLAPWAYVMDADNMAEIDVTLMGRERRTLEMYWNQRRIWGVTAGLLQGVRNRLFAP